MKSCPEFADAVAVERAVGKDEREFRIWLRHPFRGKRPPTGKGHGGKPIFTWGHPAVVIDIAAVKFLAPAAIVAILARWHRWKREGTGVSLVGAESCENLGYLQRIDFLTHLGVEIPENFIRRNAAGRFVPVQTLNFARGDVDKIASEITRCTLPDADFEDDVFRMTDIFIRHERMSPNPSS